MPQSFAEQLKSFPLSSNLGQSLERAHRFAREQSHRLVTLEHLLLALTEDPEAVIIMQSANVDLGRLSTDVSDHLGRLMDDMRANGAAEPRPDAELLRVLQAAASAAMQSRRRQIDGAIVLAAIVGDGKSPAAGMLKSLGMTFEEAIRALQRANTKARLKPQTKPASSTARPAAAPITSEAAKPDATPPEETRTGKPTAPAAPVSAAQTAEEILAAARERIRQRSAAAKAERAASVAQPAEAVPVATPEVSVEPATDPVDTAETETLAGAIEAAMTAAPVRASPPTPSPTAAAAAEPPPAPYSSRPSWTPPAERRPARGERSQASPLPRPIQPGEGPPRPPLPPRAQAGFFPNRPPRAPWAEPGEPAHGPRVPLPNGNLGGPHRGAPEGYPLAPPWPTPPPPQRSGGVADRGPLVENVPRVMRVGVAVTAEVRIARDRIDSLIMALSGRGLPYRPDAFATRALSVRLRAPNGGFWIEPASPETQWADDGSSTHLHDDYAVWRWTVMPHRHGHGRLLLMVSARTVGHDGLAAESAPPDRAIDVKVRANHLRSAGYGAAWIVAVLIGVTLGHFGRELWDAGSLLVSKLMGG